MRSICVYHSETGNTHAVMEEIIRSIASESLRVRDMAGYGKATMYLLGAPRALFGNSAEIEPSSIDLRGYDLVIIGSPVWASRPTPAVNAIFSALKNASGKKTVLVCTSGGSPGDTLKIMSDRAQSLGMEVLGRYHIPHSIKGRRDDEELNALKGFLWDIARS
ncbi:hypothetical protein RJ53_05620 [Methanocalculus chunghsingensis]|uniref:Flavodoxin n=1 Tax=Methanocalculus chunghsingensis TaxID=156457 RepID=A0A8J7W7M3_9EURY|nr:ArsR family transcriptional regulator [Methanocalculus chunghsingensis]MBR1369008.1 hypothetical protein [Methanocalculus chunghsingensis]